jgi:fumarate reductase subunit C
MFLIQELTGPFANGRALITYHGYRHTPLYLVNGIVMVLLFTVVRILLPLMTWYRLYTEWTSLATFIPSPVLVWALVGAALSLYLNTTWYYLMVKGLLKLLRGESFKPKDE